MINPLIKLFLTVLIILSFSCKKENKWKIPVNVKFRMDINRTSCLSGNLAFTGGNIMLAYFTFDGKREQGGDVYFNKIYSPLNVNFSSNNSVPEWNFDIPQGTYSQIKISYKTFGNAGDNDIIITGTYKNNVDSTYPVRFEFDVEEAYEIISKSSSGNSQIIIDKNVTPTPVITMDPVYWFQPVTRAMLDTANVTNIGGNETLLINKATNSFIYEAIKNRVHDDVTQVIFN